jgi:tRNA (cytidine/uridine-2'-O-)-methyltransferase
MRSQQRQRTATPMHVVLYQPEIPPNTGNVIRLCANTGAHLHLIRPLGVDLDDRRLRRAGLDYHEFARVMVHDTLADCLQQANPQSMYAFSTRGQRRYSDVVYQRDDMLLFGSETRGLPADVLDAVPVDHRLRMPMLPDSRSLNLSNAVAVAVFEAWRQQGFASGG